MAVVNGPVSESELSMNYVLFCQPVLARKEVETIANGGDKGGVAGRVLAYKVSYGRF
jgi:hypothetical protein